MTNARHRLSKVNLHHHLPLSIQNHPFPRKQLLDMLIQPIPPHHLAPQKLRPPHHTHTLLPPTRTRKRLPHLPLRTRIKERQLLALPDAPRSRPHLQPQHVEHQRRRRAAAVVAVHQVAVEVHVAVEALHGRVAAARGRGCGVDFAEECVWREGYEGDGAGGEGVFGGGGAGDVLDFYEVWVRGLRPGDGFAGFGGFGHCGWGLGLKWWLGGLVLQFLELSVCLR